MSDPIPPPGAGMSERRFRKGFLLLLAVGISILFLLVIQRFLLTVLLAAVFAGLASPLHGWLAARTGPRVAATATLVLLLAGVGLPLAGFLTLVTSEAVQISQGVEAWVGEGDRMAQIHDRLARIPFAGRFIPEEEQIVERIREAAGGAGSFLMGTLAAATRGTLNVLLQLLVLLYALFYFLIDGPRILQGILRFVPLEPGQKSELLERFVSVTRATLRGSLLIGLIQGGVAGLAFWVAGVPGSAFWGTVMVVLSIIPAVGAALIWVPAVIFLFMQGQVGAGVGLLIWCAVVVGTIDNLLRPRLIGRDARMSDLMILLSTLGGIVVFGAMGFIVGPIVAALFVTIWHIYGDVFHDWLPAGPGLVEEGAPGSGQARPGAAGSPVSPSGPAVPFSPAVVRVTRGASPLQKNPEILP
jgi:predicted PurR-regulated permease PerM